MSFGTYLAVVLATLSISLLPPVATVTAETHRPQRTDNELVYSGTVSYKVVENEVMSSTMLDTTKSFKIGGFDYGAFQFYATSLTAGGSTNVVHLDLSANKDNWTEYGDVDSVTVSATPDTVNQYRKTTLAWPQWAQYGRLRMTTRSDSMTATIYLTMSKIGPVTVP